MRPDPFPPADVPEIPDVTALRWIGSGGFADVYRGIQEGLRREVAVKVLKASIGDRRARARFREEAAVLGRFGTEDRHVLQVFHAGVLPDQRPYLVTELCDTSLHGLVVHHGPLPVARAVELAAGVAQGLGTVHGHAVVHGDITPQNVLVNGNGVPKLADFGLSFLTDAPRAGGGGLNPTHAAPEVLRGGEATAATDVYGLGSTLYTLLAGEAPFALRPGEEPIRRSHRIVAEPPARIARTDLPDELWALVEAMLAKDESARPGAGQAAARLDALLGAPSHPAPSHPAPPVPPAPRPVPPGPELVPTQGRVAPEAPSAAPVDGPELAATRLRPDAPTAPVDAPGGRSPRRGRLAVVGGLATVVIVAAAATAAFLARGGDPAPPAPAPAPPTTPSTRAAAPAPDLVLDLVDDRGGQLVLHWSGGPPGAVYAVVAGREGAPKPDATIVNGATDHVLPVDPGVAYCLQVQGTQGSVVYESNVIAVRGARCRFRINGAG